MINVDLYLKCIFKTIESIFEVLAGILVILYLSEAVEGELRDEICLIGAPVSAAIAAAFRLNYNRVVGHIQNQQMEARDREADERDRKLDKREHELNEQQALLQIPQQSERRGSMELIPTIVVEEPAENKEHKESKASADLEHSFQNQP